MATLKARIAKLERVKKEAIANPPAGLSADQLYAWHIRQPAPRHIKTTIRTTPITTEEAEATYREIMGPTTKGNEP